MTTNLAQGAQPDKSEAWQWHQHDFQAMNTAVHVWSYTPDATLTAQTEALFRRQERSMSRFDAASELSRLNQHPAGEVRISPDLFAPLNVALAAAAVTEGIYDPTILGNLEQAGYDCSFEHVVERAGFCWTPPPELVQMPGVCHRRQSSYRQVTLLPQTHTVRRPAGLGIDLGGMGKGWTVDRAAELLNGQGPFLVNAGGDLYAHGAPGDPRGWRIAVEHPLHPERRLAWLRLTHHALATSSVMKRRWRQNGQMRHHLIDPRTGQPAVADALSVTVVAERTVTAEILAKTALILGVEAGLAWLGAMAGVAALIYTDAGRLRWTPSLEPMIEEIAADGSEAIAAVT